MKNKLPDGTVISANSLITGRARKTIRDKHTDYSFHKASILKIHYTDDPSNRYKFCPEYDIVLVNGPREGEFHNNVVAMNLFGGINNFCETVYKPRIVHLEGKELKNSGPEKTDASYVTILFLNGYHNAPVIIGGYPHPKNTVQGCTKENGQLNDVDVGRILGEYNGIRWEVNNKGEFYLTYYGGPRDSKTKTPTRSTTGPTQLKIDENGIMTISTVGDATVVIDGQNNKIQLQGATIELGDDILEKIVKATKMITQFNAHTHSGPTGPTGVPLAPLTENDIASLRHFVE